MRNALGLHSASEKGWQTRTIKQDKLSSECWMIQFQGLEACRNCPYKNTAECGGKAIRKTLMNEKGHKVPL